LRAVERDGVEVLRVAEVVDPVDEDPHVWHDPVRMAEGARRIAERLGEVGGGEVDWSGRGERVAADILAAHEDAVAILDAVPERCRLLVTNHDSLSYFAARYGFEVVGSVIPGTSSQAEPSAAELAELADTLRAAGVPAVFAEVESSRRLAETLAAEVGGEVEVVALHTESLGEPDSGAASYPDLIRTNAQLIADALADC
jgi:zinc/manganese transport system substrate-binding protein